MALHLRPTGEQIGNFHRCANSGNRIVSRALHCTRGATLRGSVISSERMPPVEAERFDDVIRALVGTPSRRALNRSFFGLTFGALLGPLLGGSDAEAGGGHGDHQHHKHQEKKKNKRKKQVSQRCATNYTYCPAGEGDAAAGVLSGCCRTDTDVEGNPYEVCTDCGCCPYNSTCCRSAVEGLCCPANSQCSFSADFKTTGCCAPNDKVCFGGCCDPGDECCTMNDGTPYCCSGEEGLTCKKSNGPTCIKA